MGLDNMLKVWNELDGTVLLNRVFSGPVEIGLIDLFDFDYKRDSSSVRVSFDLVSKLPDQPVKKWVDYNRCRCGINCTSVNNIKVVGSPNCEPFLVEISNDKKIVRISNHGFIIEISCFHIQFNGPNVYYNGNDAC